MLESLGVGERLACCACDVAMKSSAVWFFFFELFARASCWNVELEVFVPLFVDVHNVSK